MLALSIAIVALGLAGYAAYSANVTRAQVAELAAALTDDEEEAEDEAQELWLSDGEMYAADKAALEAACVGAVAFCTYEGVPCAVVPGQGVVSLHKLLTDAAKVRAIKP
jgi:hypothetical protein